MVYLLITQKRKNMKKLLTLMLCLFSLQMVVRADNDKTIQINQLPKKAQLFIETHFSGVKVAYAKEESELLDKNYDVVFTNGNKVEFDKKGEWKQVDCKQSELPAGIVPEKIKDYVTENYSGEKMLKIERDKKTYEVKLSNKLELKFNMKFNLIELDN